MIVDLGIESRLIGSISSKTWELMKLLEPLDLDSLVGKSGPWREHCDEFEHDRDKRIDVVRKMTPTQQCDFYRLAAFFQRGQS